MFDFVVYKACQKWQAFLACQICLSCRACPAGQRSCKVQYFEYTGGFHELTDSYTPVGNSIKYQKNI